MQLSIKTNFPGVQRQLKGLRQDIAQKATASALNKMAAQAKTAMGREIRAEFVLPAKTVGDSLRVSRARASGAGYFGGRSNLQATLSSISKAGRRGLNLIHFNARQMGTGVSFKVRKSGPRKTIRGSFIANDGRTVFVRTGRERLPIKALSTVDLQGMFNTKRINAQVVATIEAKLPAIFANEVRYWTQRFNAQRVSPQRVSAL